MKLVGVAALVLAGVTATPAAAQMVRAQDPASVVRVLKAEGLPATLGTDGEGDPMVSSSYEGTDFRVVFYNCTKNKDCRTVQFHAGYDLDTALTLDKINAWNAAQRFGRGYVDAEGDPILQMDIDLDDGGMSAALFADNLEFWTSLIGQFEKHIGYDAD